MKRTTQMALTAALGLHLVALALLAIFTFLASLRPEPRPIVMELVELDAPVAPEAQPPMPVEEVPVTVEQLDQLMVPEFEASRDVADLPPPPAPRPVPTPAPAPAPAPAPTPVKRQTYEEYLREQGGAIETTPARPTARPRPVEVPTVETSIRERFEALKMPALPATWSPARRSQYVDYRQGLVSRLQALFQPVGRIGLSVTVAYTVQPDGRLTDVRVVRSSGQPAADDAALDAFRRLARYRPTPDGLVFSSEVEFVNVPQ